MAVDDTKLMFRSEWDIDKFLTSGTKVVGATSTTGLYTFTGDPPTFEVQFQPSGSGLWYQVGYNDHGGTKFKTDAYIDTNTLYVYCQIAGTVRYYVWGDKVNY